MNLDGYLKDSAQWIVFQYTDGGSVSSESFWVIYTPLKVTKSLKKHNVFSNIFRL